MSKFSFHNAMLQGMFNNGVSNVIVCPLDFFNTTSDLVNFFRHNVGRYIKDIYDKDTLTIDKEYTLSFIVTSKLSRKKKDIMATLKYIFDGLHCEVKYVIEKDARVVLTFSKKYTSTEYAYDQKYIDIHYR